MTKGLIFYKMELMKYICILQNTNQTINIYFEHHNFKFKSNRKNQSFRR